jgi:uncharacterized protein with NAD-binding domain and iron-sulfur cluster
MREDFYKKFGDVPGNTYGFGTSELAFLRYEIRRGVLDPLTGDHPGSPWWRGVNSDFLYFSELAGLIFEAGLTGAEVSHEVRKWLDYLQAPSATSWYEAHNTSIVRGYLDRIRLARMERRAEQLFMNEVLYRLLFAEALATGVALGDFGEIIASPLLPSVDILTHLPAFYPEHYPLTPEDVINVRHLGSGLDAEAARVLDELLILPHLDQLYHLAEEQLELPQLDRLIRDGKPVYPDVAEELRKVRRPGRRRVAILGGGASALAAAWELTRHGGWQERYDVTVYTMGWRLGGKTATGRGPFQRIEEHGIHILQGWYDVTFKLLRAIYDERRVLRIDPRAPFQRWQEGFEPNNSTLLTEYIEGRGWVNWPLIFPPNDATPGEGPPLSIWQLIKKAVGLTLELLLGSPYLEGQGPIIRWILDHFFPPEGALHRVARWLGVGDEAARPAEDQLLSRVLDQVDKIDEGLDGPLDLIMELLAFAVEILRKIVDWKNQEHDTIRRVLLLAELVLVNLRGIMADVWQPATRTFDWSRIDHLDYRAWLASHGASEQVRYSTPVRFFYTGTFSNLEGPWGEGGLVAAGTALRFVLTSVGYKGSFVYQFRAGTGDTMIMPFYEVLRARGVRFEFFREVQEVHRPEAGGEIERVTIGEQVTLKGESYEPSTRVGAMRAWPAHPLYDQIDPAQAEQLRINHVDLESPWADWVCPVVKTLEKGRDFDDLVLAIPVATLRSICPGFYEHDARWRSMIDGVKTTATMSMQIWLAPTLEQLGFNRAAWGLAERNNAPNVVVYESPMYSWLDSTLVRWTERWPLPQPPGLIAYFTGAMSDPAVTPGFDDHGYPERARDELAALSNQWVRDNMGWFWPAGSRPEAPSGVSPMLWLGPTADASAAERQAFQYYRANVDPWQRYTLSAPGSAKHRLRADQSGYRNLFLAGDWIDFGMNVGYIEGALLSGIQAAQAIRTQLGLATPGEPEALDVP